MWIVKAKTVETERKPFIYYMHLSLNLAPIFCLKGHIPYIHCWNFIPNRETWPFSKRDTYLYTWKSFYFLQLPTIQVALIFIACFTQNPTLTTSTLWWDSFLNCILIVFLIFTIYFSNLCITIRSDYNLNILWNISWNRKCVK